MRVLVLVISDNSLAVYARNREAIRECVFNSHPDFDCYFVESDPNVEVSGPRGDTFVSKSESGFATIVQKTTEAIECYTATTAYDYVLRTNLSSFWVFSNLVPVIATLPTTGCLYGVTGREFDKPFVSGAGMLMSIDVAQHICKTWRHYDCQYDDLVMSTIAADGGATFIRGVRIDLLDGLSSLSFNWSMQHDSYHYRLKCNDGNKRHEEAEVIRRLYQMHADKGPKIQ